MKANPGVISGQSCPLLSAWGMLLFLSFSNRESVPIEFDIADGLEVLKLQVLSLFDIPPSCQELRCIRLNSTVDEKLSLLRDQDVLIVKKVDINWRSCCTRSFLGEMDTI